MRRAAIAFMLSALLAGCAGGVTSGSDGVLRVQVSGEPEETKVYQAVVAAFEREHEDIDITLVEVPEKDEHLAKLATSFAGGDAPEVFLINYREYAQFVARGAIEPYQGFLEANDIDPNDYFPQPLEAFTYDGALQCMPQNISSLVIYYNTDLFSEAGLEAPPPGWDWQSFREIAWGSSPASSGSRPSCGATAERSWTTTPIPPGSPSTSPRRARRSSFWSDSFETIA